MNKKTILIINPISINLMKGIHNVLITELLDLIILGNRNIINTLCNEINLNINSLQIIDCNNQDEIYEKLKQYSKIKNIFGIIYDDFNEELLLDVYDINSLGYLIDFGIFKKSVLLVRNSNKKDQYYCLNEMINIINNLNFDQLKISIVKSNKEKTNLKAKQIKQILNIQKIDNIDITKIKKCKYNIIIFDDKFKEIEYINKIKNMFLPRIIEIKKASNMFIFDAKNKEFKNIFIQFLFLNKINCLNNKVNTQAI